MLKRIEKIYFYYYIKVLSEHRGRVGRNVYFGVQGHGFDSIGCQRNFS